MTGIELQVHQDVVFSNQGTIICFTPLTPEGEAWFAENVEVPDWAYQGPSICADHRPGLAILAGLLESGLRVADASAARVVFATGRMAQA